MKSYRPGGRRQAAERHGRWAETVAAWWLRLKGYRILERGLSQGRGSGAGQIDIVARRAGVVAFVEVKARADLAQAAESLGFNQRRRIARAAEAYAARRVGLAGCCFRFDVVLVAPGRLPRHLPDAWRME